MLLHQTKYCCYKVFIIYILIIFIRSTIMMYLDVHTICRVEHVDIITPQFNVNYEYITDYNVVYSWL